MKLTWLFIMLISLSLESLANDKYQIDKELHNFTPRTHENNAGAVILKNNMSMNIDNVDHYEINYHVVIAILSDKAARDYSRISLNYNSFFKDLELISARSISQDGVISNVSSDAVQIKTDSNPKMFNDSRHLAFALPRLSKGSFLEYRYRTRVKSPPIPGYWDQLFFLQEYIQTDTAFRVDPVRHSSVQITAPKAHQFKYQLKNVQAKFNKVSSGGNWIYSWHAKDLPGIEYETHLPSLQNRWAYLKASSISSWRDIDNWASNIYLSKAKANNEINLKAVSVTKKYHNDKDKVRALFYFMLKNVRYISADVLRGGLTPHKATETWNNRYGDCKDQATLFISMLDSIGIKAYPALVGVYPQIDVSHEIPSINFSHMIVYIPSIDGGIWIDTSGDWGTYPGIHWEIEKRHAFVINGNGGELLNVSTPKGKINKIDYYSRYQFKSNDLTNTVNISIYGDNGDRFKNFAKTSQAPENEIESILKELYTRAESVSIAIDDNASEDLPFKITAKVKFGDVSNIEDQFSFASNISSILNAFTPLNQPPSPEGRINDVFFGTEFQLNYNIDYRAPELSYRPTILNNTYRSTNPHFSYEHKIEENKDYVKAKALFHLKNGVIDADNYKNFYSNIEKLEQEASWSIIYQKDKHYATQKKLESLVSNDSNDTDSVISLARHHISLGNYDKAESLIDDVIMSDKRNGEAHYLLGVIYGYKDQFEKSQQHFKKAESNGYIP